MSNEAIKALITRTGAHTKGIGATTLKRAALTRWAGSVSRREVVEAAKKFGDKVLYTLAGLSIAGLREREEEGQ